MSARIQSKSSLWLHHLCLAATEQVRGKHAVGSLWSGRGICVAADTEFQHSFALFPSFAGRGNIQEMLRSSRAAQSALPADICCSCAGVFFIKVTFVASWDALCSPWTSYF